MGFEHMDDVRLELKNAVKNKEITRRDALKAMAFVSALAAQAGFAADANDTNKTDANKTDSNATKKPTGKKMVIIGGGAAGLDTAHRLLNEGFDDVTIIEPNETHYYQPAYTLVYAGVKSPESIQEPQADYTPSKAKWIKAKATAIDPDNFKVTLDNNQTLDYDYLIVACGLQINTSKVVGLDDVINKPESGVFSIYTLPGAIAGLKMANEFKGKKALFTNPQTAIKCGGAPQKAAFLFADTLTLAGKREGVEVEFCSASAKLFGVPEYHDAVMLQMDKANIKRNFKHTLVEVKGAEKIAVFEVKNKVEKGVDPETKEKIFEEVVEKVEKPYDLLHVVPPMSAPDFIVNGPLSYPGGTAKGWLKVNKETLQHFNYPNIFGVGDVCGTPFGKTGGTARKQVPIMISNLKAVIDGKTPEQKFNGYTVCPLIVKRGEIMMLEFDYDAKPAPSFPLDPTQPRWIWWIFKCYLLPPMYWHGMLMGRA